MTAAGIITVLKSVSRLLSYELYSEQLVGLVRQLWHLTVWGQFSRLHRHRNFTVVVMAVKDRRTVGRRKVYSSTHNPSQSTVARLGH